MAAKIRKGDNVVVLSGIDEGKTGEVIKVMPKEGRALVRGIRMATVHQKKTEKDSGGIIRKEAPIHLSSIALADPQDGKPTRVGFRIQDGKKVRFAKRSGELIDG